MDLQYETILDLKTSCYNDYKNFLSIMGKIIEDKKFIIYGGYAIHCALKLKGHKGIYDEQKLPDYDVFSDNFYLDSIEAANKFYNLDYTNVSAISAAHITTRVLTIGFYRLCDITYFNFKKLPTLTYKGMLIAHPLFLKIPLYYVLSLPYGFELSENMFHRFSKDCKRLNLLNEYYPIEVETNEKISYKDVKIPIDNKKYISGLIAYAMYYEKSKDKSNLIKITYNNNILSIPDNILFINSTYYDYTKNYKKEEHIKRFKFYDYLPKSLIIDNKEYNTEIIEIKYTIQCIHNIKHENVSYNVLNIYNLVLYFLCYYFLTIDNPSAKLYLQLVKSLQNMIKNNDNEIFKYSFNPVGDIENNYTFSEAYKKSSVTKNLDDYYIPPYYPKVSLEYKNLDITELPYVQKNINTIL